MTTIELEFTNMANQGQPPPAVRLRISQETNGGHKSDGDIVTSNRHSPRPTRPSVRKGQRERPDTLKSPARVKPKQQSSIDMADSFSHYDPHMFTIIAYLPNEGVEGEKRLKLYCHPGMTVQQVIDSQIPYITDKPYVVYQFPSRALLNPEKEASVLQDQEIWIEPARIQSPEEVGDERLAVVKELYRTEDAYLEHLKNIFDVYMDPMRNWGMPQTDMNTLFIPLSRLCDLLMNFFSELELAVKSWNTGSTLIGGIFTQYPSFWDMYVEYAQSYTIAMRLLKLKRKDESFSKFLDIKRGAAMHTLESLMLLPVQRVSDYHRYLAQLLSLTSRDHPDYQHIRVTVARTDEIIQARADELVYLQNESKLEYVQLQFPNDQLFLFDKLEVIEASTPKRSKSVGQPPVTGNKGSIPLMSAKYKTSSPSVANSGGDFVDSPGSRKNLRMYIQEGPVKLLVVNKQSMLQSQERYLFLFSDLMLIAKGGKSRTQQHRVYRLKNRIRLSEMWVSETVDAVLPPHECGSAFTIGWPITNCIAVFGCEAEKVLWFNLVSKNIELQQQLAVSDSVSIQVHNMTKSTNSLQNVVPQFMQVHVSETCADILKKALKHFQIMEDISEFQLCVKLAKEDKEDLLHGYESPFAIQCNHNRQQLDLSNDVRPQQLEFVVRKKLIPSTPTSGSRSIFKKIKFKRGGTGSSKDLKTPKQEKMFAVPLDELIINNQLPEKLQEILIRLWVEAPGTFGIFRLNGNARKIKEVKEDIDGRKIVDISDVNLHVISSLLKDLLRNVPGGVIPSSRYTEFVATLDINNNDMRIEQIRKILNKLPASNQVFLRYLLILLHHISLQEEINQMTSTNLAICFAPSLLEPEYSLAVIKNEAPSLIDFMIKHAMSIYNNEIPELFKQLESVVYETSESERETVEHVQLIPVKVDEDIEMFEDGFRGHRRIESMDTCTSDDSLDEDDLTTRRRLPLHHTASDSQVDEYGPPGVGRVLLMSDRSERTTGNEGDRSDSEDEEETSFDPKRPRHSPYTANPSRIRHKSGDSMGRRRSIATQGNPMSHNLKHFSPELQPVGPSSPHSRGSSHSSGSRYSPMFPHRIEHDSDGSSRGGHRSEPSVPRPSRKKRSKPGHSNSFSKPSDLQYKEATIPQSTSFSYYDSLLPIDRPRSHTVASSTPRPPDDLTTSLEKGIHRTSNQSINSRGSVSSGASQSRTTWSQNQPTSTTSLLSNRSGGSGSHRSASPDALSELANTPLSKMNPEFIKHAISHRFGLDRPQNRTSDFNPPNPILEATPPSSPLSKDEVNVRPRQGMKRMESSETNTSIDDRPEAERHLNSLPRSQTDYKEHSDLVTSGSLGRRGVFGPAEMMPLGYSQETGSRLTIISGGYNSDTESSPSRTLNRQDKKLQEVASSSPYSIRSSLPQRYSRLSDSNIQTSMSSLRSMDSLERPPSIEEDTIKERMVSSNEVSPLSSQSLESKRSRALTVGHGGYTGKTVTGTPVKGIRMSENLEQGMVHEKRSETLPQSSQSPEDKKGSSRLDKSLPVPVPHVGTRQLASTNEHKSRSMPDYNKRIATRTLTSSSNIKTVRVIRYELPTPKKIRRINLRAYHSSK